MSVGVGVAIKSSQLVIASWVSSVWRAGASNWHEIAFQFVRKQFSEGESWE